MNSLHYQNYDHLGQITIRQDGYVNRYQGYITSEYQRGKTKGFSEERFLKGKLFLKATSYTLTVFYGFKKQGAAKYGNKWIFIPKSDVTYINLTSSLTLSGQIQQIKIPGNLTYLKNPRLNGKKVMGILGHPTSVGGIKETETLYVSPTGSHLPLKATLTQGKTGAASLTFLKWNIAFKVSVPKKSTPIAKTGLE